MQAYDVEIDGLFYNLKNSNYTATVTHDNFPSFRSYSGDLVIPSSIVYNGKQYTVTTIGKQAFHSGVELLSVVIPNTVTSIEREAFIYCNSLSSVSLPNTITAIKSSTFEGCSSLMSIQIPNSVTTINNNAFYGSGLTSIHIPNSITSIGYRAFDETPWYESQPNGVVYIDSFVYKYKGSMSENTSIAIKPATNGIAAYAFEGCENLMSIEFPNTLKYVGQDAFLGTEWYENLPDGLVYAGQVPLHYKGALPPNTDLVIKDGTISIGEEALFIEGYYYDGYDDYDGLVSVTIPNSVQYIGKLAFSDCHNLKRVIIGSGIEEIGEWAFAWNENLTDVTISEGLKVIGEQMFAGCKNLRKIIIPNTAEVIRYRAFGEIEEGGDWVASESCISLTDVTIGSSVKTIQEKAFSGCKAITKVTCLATVPPVMEDVSSFDEDNYTEAILFVPKGYELDYMMAYGWKKFIHIVGIDVHTDACDVNGDGSVNISDLNYVINDILAGKGDPSMDVNGDGSVNISDINFIIQTILSAN